MSLSRSRVIALTVLVVASLLPAGRPPARAEQPWNAGFLATWQRTDEPVASLRVSRTWMWGPAAITPGVLEEYAEGPGGARLVQYFDKSRMEVAASQEAGNDSMWRVTNGLLAKEMITGQRQIGNALFEPSTPAQVNVAGDVDDPNAPTYATFTPLLDATPAADGAAITQRLTRQGPAGVDPSLAAHGVVAAHRVTVPGIDHQVASPFWAFMNSSGVVREHGALVNGPLFLNPFYATGYPITEAYWTTVRVGGVPHDVLMQCFERRCLTYTPSNSDGWKVEAGNTGRHYFTWRYGDGKPVPAPEDDPIRVVLDPGHDRTTGGAIGQEYRETMRTALATKAALEAAGYEVFLTRPDNATALHGDPALMPGNAAAMDFNYNEGYAHTTRALQFQPDIYISLHYNGSVSAAAAGMTIYYCDHAGPQNATLAALVRDELLAALRSRGYEPPYARAAEDGEIGKSYGHLATLGNVYSAPFAYQGNRLHGVPTVLVEPLFMTNPAELALLGPDATHEAFALAYLLAIDAYFGR